MMEHILIKNVLSNKERKKLIKDSQQFLMDGDEMGKMVNKSITWPGKQTLEHMYLLPSFGPIIYRMLNLIKESLKEDLIVTYAWINWTNGKKEDLCWHDHPSYYSAVYYMQTFPFFSNGTLFEDGLVKAPQNSLLVFPSRLQHTAPSSPLRFERYTMALELEKYNV